MGTQARLPADARLCGQAQVSESAFAQEEEAHLVPNPDFQQHPPIKSQDSLETWLILEPKQGPQERSLKYLALQTGRKRFKSKSDTGGEVRRSAEAEGSAGPKVDNRHQIEIKQIVCGQNPDYKIDIHSPVQT